MSEGKVAGERFCLYDTAALQAVLDRMAAQAATFLAGEADPLLLGILRRGVPLAEMLQERLRRQHGLDLPCYGLRLKRYADDLTLLHPETELTENAEFSARELSRATVLVVDDERAIRRPIATSAAWSSAVMSEGTSVVVAAYGHITNRPNSWNEIEARICCRPSMTRLATRSRIAAVSGAENGAGPR